MNKKLLYEDLPPDAPLPVKEWSEAMQSAVDEICDLGEQLVEVHKTAGEKAAEIAEDWRLAERQAEERDALHTLFAKAKSIVEQLDITIQNPCAEAMRKATEVIESGLPEIEKAFLVVRHSALDLLRWTRRSGKLEGSTLPDAYRAGYARFISYAPILRERLENLQQELMHRAGRKDAAPEVVAFQTAVSRYNAFALTSRSFVQAVVDPPLDLTFRETNIFLVDWEASPLEVRTHVGSAVNDCCQFLLYDVPAFERQAERVELHLGGGMEASLYEMNELGLHILFTVDEDPLFGQITITLLRMVDDAGYEEARSGLIKSLYTEFEVDHG